MNQVWDEPYHVILEIENTKCKVLKMMEEQDIKQFKVIDIRSHGGGLVRHLVRLPIRQANKIPSYVLIKKKDRPEKESQIWIESEGCDVCNTILAHGSFLISGRHVKNDLFIYDFIVPNFDAFKSILTTLESYNIKVKILKVVKYGSKKEILTEKQERILWLAYKMGFFDYPRKINMEELSRKLGISPSTLSEMIRRGIRKLLMYHFEK